MKAITRTVLLLWLGGLCAVAADDPPAAGGGAIRLADLAGKADFVALAQIRDTDYLRRRDMPVSGSAYLRILIPYKGDRAADLVEVYEKGLHERECYFENPTVFEEGRRYLLFLRRDPEHPERYRGLPEGCAIDVLVGEDHRYAVRLPVSGIELAEPLNELARPMRFRDPYAVREDGTQYTHGIPLAEFSDRMRLGASAGPDRVQPTSR